MSSNPSRMAPFGGIETLRSSRLTTAFESIVSANASKWLSLLAADHTASAQMFMDAVVIASCLLVAFLVRYEALNRSHLLQFFFWLPILVFSRLIINRSMGVYKFVWKFVCLSDALKISRSMAITTGTLLALRAFYPEAAPFSYWLRLPVGVIVPEFLLSLSLSLAARASSRIAFENLQRSGRGLDLQQKRVIMYGAGRAGMLLALELMAHPGLEIVGFVDDDPKKLGTVINGFRVLASGNSLEALVRSHNVNEILISIAATSQKEFARIVDTCKRLPVNTRIIPSAEEIIAGRVSISHLREVRIDDLLGRRSVSVGEIEKRVFDAYEGKKILVTGAGGSIGSELTRQLLLMKPASISILDKDENSIFDLEHELRFRDPKAVIEPLIADIRIRERVFAVIRESQPDIVFHAAAHKHVPLMEKHPCEAVLNNVMGTRHLLETCFSLGTERFVFISSDKAVNPVNVMGATKRIGEKLVSTFAGGSMHVTAVRFGNVMGSRGSVIPLFQKQIEAGGPVTVTHPDIVRFFMTIPEAVQLVVCAGTLADQGKIFVLDMGNPRKVLDLARQMIQLAGLEPEKDIPILITGLRPGEKMHEELAGDGEALIPTCFEKIFEIQPASLDRAVLCDHINALIAAAHLNDRKTVYSLLSSMDLGYARVANPKDDYAWAA